MKKFFLWLLVVGTLFFVSVQVSQEIRSRILYLSDGIKSGIFNLHNNITNLITRHFNQVSQIKFLTNELKDKEVLENQLKALMDDYNDLLYTIQSNLSSHMPKLDLVRTISYVTLNDYNKIWIEFKKKSSYKEGTIFGLIHDNQAQGIAIYENGRLMGYLNGDEECNYSVVIGENKSPGIAKGTSNGDFIIDYIPLYPKVNIGDTVYTSGHDEIFYANIYVGEVVSVKTSQGYQIATIKLPNKKVSLYYWLVDTNFIEKDSQNSQELEQNNLID